jgi:hypothetical protein
MTGSRLRGLRLSCNCDMIFMETTRLRALYYTPNLRPLFINVYVEHHHIGGGHSIPALSTWFAGRLYVTCCDIKVDSQNLCVYIARRTKNDAIDRTTCWFIIFQYAQDGQYLATWPLRNSFSKADVVHT